MILVSVSIAVSIGAAYWLGGFTGQYFDYESVEITHIKNSYLNDMWTITIELKDTGPSDVTLMHVFINGIEVDSYGSDTPAQGSASTDAPSTGFRLSSGEQGTLHIYMDGPEGAGRYRALSSGTTINITLHSALGVDYSKMIELT